MAYTYLIKHVVIFHQQQRSKIIQMESYLSNLHRNSGNEPYLSSININIDGVASQERKRYGFILKKLNFEHLYSRENNLN